MGESNCCLSGGVDYGLAWTVLRKIQPLESNSDSAKFNGTATKRLKQLWKKLVRMFHPDLHEQDPEKRRIRARVDRKSFGRIMDSRIIFEDR